MDGRTPKLNKTPLKISLLFLVCFALYFLSGCATLQTSPKDGSSSTAPGVVEVISPEFVGEWRNSKDPIKYAALYFLSDGRGIVLGSDESDVLGFQVSTSYDSKRHILTLVSHPQPQEGPQQTFHLNYDPSSKMISGMGDVPFTRCSPKVPDYMLEEFKLNSAP